MLPGTHVALAFPIVFLGSFSIPASVGFLVGSVLPDKIDFFLSGGNFSTWKRLHRTFTHTWWLLLLCLLSLFFVQPRSDMTDLVLAAGKGLFCGMLYHTFCDFFTPMGVPYLNPMGRKRGLGLIPSRGFRATMLCLFCTALSVWLAYIQLFSDSQFASFVNEFAGRLKQAFPGMLDLWKNFVAAAEKL